MRPTAGPSAMPASITSEPRTGSVGRLPARRAAEALAPRRVVRRSPAPRPGQYRAVAERLALVPVDEGLRLALGLSRIEAAVGHGHARKALELGVGELQPVAQRQRRTGTRRRQRRKPQQRIGFEIERRFDGGKAREQLGIARRARARRR